MGNIDKKLAVNPYQLPKPERAQILYTGKFYFANDMGTYGIRTESFRLALCDKYIWISDGTSIPLGEVIESGLSKKGGYITYLDRLSNEVVKFNFTKLGIIGFRREEVEKLLALVEEHLPGDRPKLAVTADSTGFDTHQSNAVEVRIDAPPVVTSCEECDEKEVYVLLFKRLRFFGIAPLAYSYCLTPTRFVLCKVHARKQAIASSFQTALYGYLGFPGFLAAPWYVCRNLWELRRAKAVDIQTIVEVVTLAIVLPLGVLTAAVWAIWYFSPPV